MKTTLLAAAMLAALSGATLAQAIADVPSSHWAYEAVQELVGKGYLALESGRFEGDRPVDRFTLATVVARLLHEFETGGAAPRSEEDVALLRSLVNEFREELVLAYAEINAAKGEIDQNARSIVVLEGGMSRVQDMINQLAERSLELETQLAAVDAAQRAELGATAAALRTEIEELARLIEAEGEARARLQGEVLAMIDGLRQEAAEGIDENRQAIGDAQNRVAALEEALKSELAAQGVELGDLQGRLAQTTSQIESELSRLKSALEAEITHQLQLEKERLAQLADEVENALAEVRSELNVQAEALLAQRIALEQQKAEIEAHIAEIEARLAQNEERIEAQGAALAQADGELMRSINELSGSVSALKTQVAAASALADRLSAAESRVEGVERQVLAMQSQIGLSEEQIAALSERVMTELDSQLQHNILLAQSLERELNSLRNEFNSYRQSTEANLSRANQAQMFGLIGALLGLIGLVAN